jgi:hypothetical protein
MLRQMKAIPTIKGTRRAALVGGTTAFEEGKAMDVAMIRNHLELACQHIVQGDRRIERQREIVASYMDGSPHAASARNLLKVFEETQTLHMGDRHRLEQMLAQETERLRR